MGQIYGTLVALIVILAQSSVVQLAVVPYTTSCMYDKQVSANGCEMFQVKSREVNGQHQFCYAGRFVDEKEYLFYVIPASLRAITIGIVTSSPHRLSLLVALNQSHYEGNAWKGLRFTPTTSNYLQIDDTVGANISCWKQNVMVSCKELNIISGPVELLLSFQGDAWWSPYCLPDSQPNIQHNNCFIPIVLLAIVSVAFVILASHTLLSFLISRGLMRNLPTIELGGKKDYLFRNSLLRPNVRFAIYREDNIFEESVPEQLGPSGGRQTGCLTLPQQTPVENNKQVDSFPNIWRSSKTEVERF